MAQGQEAMGVALGIGGAHDASVVRKRGDVMTCTRCQGLMVEDYLLDVQNPSGEVWILAWRCVNCGEILESMIDRNRRAGSRTERPAAVSRAA